VPESAKPPFRLSAAPEADVAQYHAVSVLGVIGLVLGLLSPLAVLNPLLWLVPLAGIAAAALSLYRISRAGGALIGRKVAVWGLVLSLACGATAMTDWVCYRAMVRSEARQFAGLWFASLRDGKPEVAFELTRPPTYRVPLDDKLSKTVLGDFESREAFRQYVADRTIATILALGPKARVRYYDTEGQETELHRETVTQTYAVTFDAPEGEKTFFVELVLGRLRSPETGQAYWQLISTSGGVRPQALGGPAV
jgi:hypothetical protein